MALEPSNIIVGPAIIIHNGMSIYTEGNITETLKQETWQPRLDMYGSFDTRLKSRLVEFSFTPVGSLSNAAKLFPYAPVDIGTDIFKKPADSTVVIWTKAGLKVSYPVGTISKMSPMHLGTNKTWLGAMTLTCKGDGTKEYTNAAAWNTISAVPFADATFDDTLVKTGRYLATWGVGYGYAYDYGSLFQNEGSQDGFEIAYEMSTKALTPDGFNVCAMLLTELKATVKFKPLDFTEAQFYDIMRLQGSSALLPGQSVSKMLSDLVITSATTGLTVTVNKVGAMEGGQLYALDNYRQGEISFASRLTFTAGAVNPLITITGAV